MVDFPSRVNSVEGLDFKDEKVPEFALLMSFNQKVMDVTPLQANFQK